MESFLLIDSSETSEAERDVRNSNVGFMDQDDDGTHTEVPLVEPPSSIQELNSYSVVLNVGLDTFVKLAHTGSFFRDKTRTGKTKNYGIY